MANFLSSCACRGARPKSVEIKGMHIREHLLSRLMEERNVLRFICAPSGFGKSILAAQYANVVFGFKKVFWVDCQSPCFIRDLDSEDIVPQIIQICENPNLVVFDNLGLLDEVRSGLFSHIIDELLEYGCEVIATSRPFKDSFLADQPDANIINSKDLLLSDDELNKSVSNDILRIPIVSWCPNYAGERIIECALKEDFPDSIVFSLFLIYLLQNNSVKTLEKYLSKNDLNLLFDFNEEYLYFGIDENKSSFSVPSIFTSKLLSHFNSKMHVLKSAMSCTDRSDLSEKLCSLLEKFNRNKESVEVACCLGNKELSLEILEKFNEDSIRNLYINSSTKLFNKLYPGVGEDGLNLSFQAWRLAIMGKTDDAIHSAYNVLEKESSSIDNMLLASLVFMRVGSNQEKTQALKIIRNLNNDFKIEAYLNNSRLSSQEKFKCSLVKKLIDVYLAIYSESINPFEKWLLCVESGIETENIICAEAIFSSIDNIEKKYLNSEYYLDFISKLSRYFSFEVDDLDFYSYQLIKTYLKIKRVNNRLTWDINENIYNKYLKYDDRFIEILNADLDNKKTDSGDEKTNNYLNANSFVSINVDQSIPILKINMLGGLCAFLGNEEIIQSSFGRQNIKLLCCILAIENGNEIGKDYLGEIIWPGSDEESQRSNINALWSAFRKIFTLPNGQCPYFIRNQNSYKLVKKYLVSDVQILEKICAELTLGPIDSQSWWELLSKNDNIISGSLLPSEHNNGFILNKRIEYKNKIVDALVSASNRLMDAGEIQQSLWFAQKALSRDSRREDVYVTLMRAQMEAGQRTPALETYFACKKFLEEDLGIDPSKKIYGMYKKVVHEVAN